MHLSWAALLLLAMTTGCAASAALVARSPSATAYGAVSIAAMLLTGSSVVSVARGSGRADTTIAAIFISVGATLGGLALGASLVPHFTRLPPVPEPSGADAPAPPVDGPPAIILLAKGQPEVYDPAVVTQEYGLLSEADVPVPSDALRLFAYLSERMRYRSVGPSRSRPTARVIAARLEGRLAEAGHPVRVYEAWLQGTPRLADATAEAHADGAACVIVVHLGIAESAPFERARGDADQVSRVGGGRLRYAPPLWPEMALARAVAQRALAALPGGPQPRDGVAVVGDGQPWQWDSAHPSSCEQATTFLQRVRSMLIAAGMDESHVRMAWLDWQDPGVTEAVRHLAALGCERIVVVPAAMPTDTLETVVDLPAAIAQAAVDPSVQITVLPAWGEDPVVTDVLTDVTLHAIDNGC